MPLTAVKLIACALLGVLLAMSWLPVTAGYLGAVVILFAAYRQRAQWDKDRCAPEAAERAALLSIAGTLACLGYFLTMLYQIGVGIDVHSMETRKMANELWVLVAASFIAPWIGQAPQSTRDELDDSIAARAMASSCYVLLVLQAALVAWFGLMLKADSLLRSIDMIVHLFIGSWMLAHVFHGLFCINAYAGLRAAERKAA